MLQLSEADHDKVSAAITAAELKSDGEIVAVATPISDAYHDVALHWALILAVSRFSPGLRGGPTSARMVVRLFPVRRLATRSDDEFGPADAVSMFFAALEASPWRC